MGWALDGGARIRLYLIEHAAQVGLLGFFTVTVAVYAAGHGVNSLAAGDLAPTWAVFVLVAPVLVYNLLTQAAASLDGAGPHALGRISARTGTPVPATLAGGPVATATTLAAFAVAGGDNSRYLSAP